MLRPKIIEAMGLNANQYWERNKRKTRDYLHHKCEVIAVVPNEQNQENTKKHLSRKVRILRYHEFEQFVSTSIEKAPNKERFSPKEEVNASNRFSPWKPLLSTAS
nr:hypothetical protein [Candidatus Njordarchaeota archaeon]